MIGNDVVSGHPWVDVALDFGRTTFGLFDLKCFAAAGGDDLVPLVVIEENELGIVAGRVGVFDFDGLPGTNRQDVRSESAIDIIENRLGARNLLERRMDLIARELGLLAIDHEDHVGDSFGAAVDD